MIEGGVAGGSAQQQAAQRRATADRLVAEAKWLEALANDERAIATYLASLPPAYAILHDLKLPGSKGNVDHLIVGPGGAFVVMARRCVEAISLRDGGLWSGEQSLHDVFEVARVESQLLTQALGTTVVPVVALLGVRLPAAAPHAIEGVLVCQAELIVRVVTRASHTLLPPHKVSEAAERALPLLHNPGSLVRTESALGVRPDPPADTSVNPVVPPHAPPSEQALKRRNATEAAALRSGPVPRIDDAAVPADPTKDRGRQRGVPPLPPPVGKERSGRSRSFAFMGAVIVSLCLVAVALGSLGRVLWSDDPAAQSSQPETGVTTAPTEITTTTLPGPMAANLPAPSVAFSPICPAPGAGWQMMPIWPGDLAGLARYEIDLQNLDASWTALKPIESPQTSWGSLLAQPPNAAYTIRIIAVMADGSRSIDAPTIITTPPTPC
ncbi:MAG: nuclease-related domain-containing protein [Ilumatobacteraceae bacterium]